MGTQDTGPEDNLGVTIHTGTQRDAAGKNIANRPTYYTRREPGAPNSPEEGGAVYPPREPPNVLTPRAAGGIGREIKIQLNRGIRPPTKTQREMRQEEIETRETYSDQTKRIALPPLGHSELSRKKAV